MQEGEEELKHQTALKIHRLGQHIGRVLETSVKSLSYVGLSWLILFVTSILH